MPFERARPHRFTPVLTLGVVVLAACGEDTPTQPEQPAGSPNVQALAAARNSWTARTPGPFREGYRRFDIGTAPNSAGESVVYVFGGTDDEGATGFTVTSYNVATDSWTRSLNPDARVGVFDLNGVGRIGNRLYFSGGSNDAGAVPNYTNQLWAYDYHHDRMIQKADVPIYSGAGLTGVIDGMLYVLPGVCSADYYPTRPGDCPEEPTRRFYRYNPSTNAWVSKRQAPHYHLGGVAGVIQGKFYVAGGRTSEFGDPVAALDVYDPQTNTWRSLAPLPTAGSGYGTVLGGQLYAFVCCTTGATQERRAYAYSPTTNRWSARAVPGFVGPVTKVTLDGSARLLMVSGTQTALYTP